VERGIISLLSEDRERIKKTLHYWQINALISKEENLAQGKRTKFTTLFSKIKASKNGTS
jgi:hypothetical protein